MVKGCCLSVRHQCTAALPGYFEMTEVFRRNYITNYALSDYKSQFSSEKHNWLPAHKWVTLNNVCTILRWIYVHLTNLYSDHVPSKSWRGKKTRKKYKHYAEFSLESHFVHLSVCEIYYCAEFTTHASSLPSSASSDIHW